MLARVSDLDACRAHERLTFCQSLAGAKAEATIVDIATIHRAGQARNVTVTTVTKRVSQVDGDLAVTEETVTVVDRPPDWRAAAWKVERRNRNWRIDKPGREAAEQLPRDMMAARSPRS